MQYTILTISSWQRIPRSFVNKCWEGMSNPVVLLLRNGAEWKVKWKKLDVDVWLIDDWKEFAGFCCLDQDHLLVFKYMGKSRFQVVIFYQNGLEMQYPLMEETIDGNSLCQPKRAKSPLPFSSSIKKVKTNPRKEPSSYPGHDHDVKTEPAQSQRRKVELSKKFHADDLDDAKPKKRGGNMGFLSFFLFVVFVPKVISIVSLWFWFNRRKKKKDHVFQF